MPTYEYRCEKCGHSFEVVRSMTAPVLKVCPEDLCARKKWGRGPVTKQVGAGAGLLFKGSGFYLTDYRSEGYKQAAKNDKAPKPESKPAETKAETKPAAKPAAKADKK
jgi:putative FmdB family regulatory protein